MLSRLKISDSKSEISRIPKFGLLYMRRDWDDDRNVSGNGMMEVVVATAKPEGKYITLLI